MEQECVNCQDLSYLINSLTSHNIHIILSFLDSDTIINIIQAQTQQSSKKCLFIEIARLKNFIQTCLNKTDRSVYMPFYSQPIFLKMEHDQISYICSHSAPGLSFLSDAFKQIFKILQNQLQDFQMSNQAVESITGSLTDPELPFPKLRKQSIGMHCNSSFQYFLVDKLFASNDGEEMEETFEQLGKFLNERWNLQTQNQKKQIQIIQEVFTSWYKIGYQNYQSYLLPNNTNHNLVVIILALIDLLIDSFTFYIESIHDPLYSFIQFNMRYCMFRNVIMSLQEKLGFLFKNYSSFCGQIIQRKSVLMIEQESQKKKLRQMTIWHCGLSKWYIYMQRQHEQYFKMFFFLLRKLNIQTLKQSNKEKIQECGIYIQLQNRIDLNQIDLLQRYQNFEVYSPLQDIFEENKEFYNQLIKQYIQYIVDISINQYSVHWCGHSGQVLHIPYQQFQNLFTENFKTYLSKVTHLAKQVSNPALAIDSILKSILYQLDRQYLKPVTLKKIVKLMEEEIIILIGEEKYQSTQIRQLIKQIENDFANKDKILNHFNESANISNEINYKYSIVLETEDFNKALKTSASTNTSRNSQGDGLTHHLHLHSSRSINYQDFP